MSAHLRLVKPEPPKPRGPRHNGLVFSEDEQVRLRTALANVRRAYGGRRKLAAAMAVGENTIACAEKGRCGFSAALAVRLARLTGLSLDAILRPGLYVVGPCPTCGQGGAP
jgi:DNA-binding XRE family transcriptional regulator